MLNALLIATASRIVYRIIIRGKPIRQVREVTAQFVLFIIFPFIVYVIIHLKQGYSLEFADESVTADPGDNNYDYWEIQIVFYFLLIPVYALVGLFYCILCTILFLTLSTCVEDTNR